MMKILIGHDGSPAADEAMMDLRNAGLPQRAQALILIACQSLPPMESLSPDGLHAPDLALAYRDAVAEHEAVALQCRRRAETAARKLRKRFQRWTVKTRVVADAPAHAILDTAERWGASLIVLGSQGWNEFKKLVMGSVADKVLNHAHCTVRLGRPRPERKGPPKLLFAYDGSPDSDVAVREMAARKWPKGTQAILAAVSEIRFRIDGLVAASEEDRFGKGPGQWAWMEGRQAKAAKLLAAAGIRAEARIAVGDPRRTLLDMAKKDKADAIVLGSHGHTGLRRVMLGSVSASVAAHAPCSVEVVHRKRKPARR